MSPTTTSTRWCPTTEQLMILEEMYKGGIRTPNASQIQQITTHLSLYGKIEGKNVFYWFQNHKARDRQKLRRKLLNKQQQQQHQHQQIIINQHHHLLHHFHATSHHQSSTSGFNHHFPHYHHLPKFLHHPQEGLVMMKEEPNEVMNYKSWVMDNNNIPVDKKVVDVDQMIMMENSSKMMYGHDWMMMMDVGSEATISPSCGSNYNKQPLKTLELFPIKSSAGSNFKDE